MCALIGFLSMSCKNPEMDPDTKEEIRIEHKIDSLLSVLTLDEKIGQMTQVLHFDPQQRPKLQRDM